MVDQMQLDQLAAAQAAARAADATVVVYLWMLGVSVVAVIINIAIVYTAVMAPSRERHTRDLELRKSRGRIRSRAALAGQRALRTLDAVESYLQHRVPRRPPLASVIERYAIRVKTRQRTIEHFLGMQLRDVDLVGYLIEIQGLNEHLLAKLDEAYWGASGVGITRGMRTALSVLTFKSRRRQTLRARLSGVVSDMKSRDISLQADLDRVWSWSWFSPFRGKNYLTTERD